MTRITHDEGRRAHELYGRPDVGQRIYGAPRAPRQPELPLKRRRQARTPEGEVMAAVRSLLRARTDVAWFARINSGKATYRNADGSERHVRFCRVYAPGAYRKLSMVDFIGGLTDGTGFAIECKARGEEPTPGQEAFLAVVAGNKGVGIVAWSAEDVEKGLSLGSGSVAVRPSVALPVPAVVRDRPRGRRRAPAGEGPCPWDPPGVR